MESTSREYEQKAQKLSGGAKKTVLQASKNMRESACRLRKAYPSADDGVYTLRRAMHTTWREAHKISESLRPFNDAASRSVKRAARRSLEQAASMTKTLDTVIRK